MEEKQNTLKSGHWICANVNNCVIVRVISLGRIFFKKKKASICDMKKQLHISLPFIVHIIEVLFLFNHSAKNFQSSINTQHTSLHKPWEAFIFCWVYNLERQIRRTSTQRQRCMNDPKMVSSFKWRRCNTSEQWQVLPSSPITPSQPPRRNTFLAGDVRELVSFI